MLSVQMTLAEPGDLTTYEVVVTFKDSISWRGRVITKKNEDWQRTLLELIQQAYRQPKGTAK